MSRKRTLVHVAGEPENGVQKCSLCGYIIVDNRNTEGPENEDGSAPMELYFATGNYVEVRQNFGGTQSTNVNMPRVEDRCALTKIDVN